MLKTSLRLFTLFILFHSIPVLKDLKVLEEQQRESQRRLETAQRMKKSRLAKQTALQAEVGSILAKNGESRAELQSMYNQLSVGQRRIGNVGAIASDAGRDLQDFNR